MPLPEAYRFPTPDHIVVVILENHSRAEIENSGEAPYLMQLAKGNYSAYYTDYHSAGHPSQPNYLDMFSGDDQGVHDDARPPGYFQTSNLAAELLAAGRTFTSYSEDLPYAGFDGDSSAGYVRKHNPLANWVGAESNQVDAMLNQPFTSFPEDFTTLPNVCFVIPDLGHDMHDGSIADGDAWVQKHLSNYVQWAKTHNSIFAVTFDEESYLVEGAPLFTCLCGQYVEAGNFTERCSHFDLLRTIEDIYKLNYTGFASVSAGLEGSWR